MLKTLLGLCVLASAVLLAESFVPHARLARRGADRLAELLRRNAPNHHKVLRGDEKKRGKSCLFDRNVLDPRCEERDRVTGFWSACVKTKLQNQAHEAHDAR